MSLRRALALSSFVLALSSQAEEVRALVAIANSVGDPSDERLRYARADADRVARVFVELGMVAPDRAYVMADQSLAAIRQKLSEVAGRLKEVRSAGKDALLILYVSAHAKDGDIHIAGDHLPVSELRDYLAKAPAQLRLLILDTCDSGAALRTKGGVQAPAYDVSWALPLRGQVVISSSGPAEPSQEWESLGGSLFTHFLVTALRGDADSTRDGSISLSEAYAYAYARTVASAAVRGQHPAVDLDLSGAGELVLTRPARAATAIVFPAALAGSYVLASQPRADFVAEISKSAGQPVRLAVPPGNYILRKRLGVVEETLGISLPYGGDSVIDEREMVRRHYAEIAVKGGQIDWRPNALVASGSALTQQLASSGLRWQASVGYRRVSNEWWGMASVGGGYVTFRGQSLTVDEWSSSARVAGGYRWLGAPMSFYAGGFLQLDAMRQAYVRDSEAEIIRNGGAPIAPLFALGGSVGPLVSIELPLVSRAFLSASLLGTFRLLPVNAQPQLSLGGSLEAGIGWRF